MGGGQDGVGRVGWGWVGRGRGGWEWVGRWGGGEWVGWGWGWGSYWIFDSLVQTKRGVVCRHVMPSPLIARIRIYTRAG